jgi:DNA modification methylase
MTINHIGQLKPDPNNARKHNQRNIGQIVSSLQEVGGARSIVIDEDNIILAGNGVIEAAGIAGIENVRVIEADGNEIIAVKRTGLTPEQKTRLALWDNRASELAEWDVDQLQIEFDSGMLDGMFSDIDLDKLGLDTKGEQPEDAEPQIDKAEELREKWGVELGQLWQLGEHRLICGDCTDKAVVDRLMDVEKASITFTSPPYNAGVSAKLRGNTSIDDNLYKDEYDDNKSQPEYFDLLKKFTDLCFDVSEYQFINIQVLAGNKKAFLEYWYHYSDKFADVAIWDKQHAAPQQAQRVMDSRFEFVLIFSKQANRAIGTNNFRGMVHNVYSGNPQRHNDYASSHAATFPVDFPEYFIEHFTNKDEIIYEPFCGTGTVIIACERLNRKCRAVEISPAYCAVTIQRWVDVTGQEPILVT